MHLSSAMLWIQAWSRMLHFFYLWVCLFWVNGWKESLCGAQICGRYVPFCLQAIATLLLELSFWPDFSPWLAICVSEGIVCDRIILLKCYWWVKLVWNQTLATHASSLGIRKELNCFNPTESATACKSGTLSETSAGTLLSSGEISGEVHESLLVNQNHKLIASAFI